MTPTTIATYQRMLQNLVLVFLGGGLGSALRLYTNHLAAELLPRPFFAGTLIVNIVGSLLIGILIGIGVDKNAFSHQATLFFTTGFCGGFTTFSTFSAEIMRLLQSQEYAVASVYIVITLSLGIGSAVLGYFIVRTL